MLFTKVALFFMMLVGLNLLLVSSVVEFQDIIMLENKSGSASWTFYMSYPMCCEDSPNFDENASHKDECEDFSGCDNLGESS